MTKSKILTKNLKKKETKITTVEMSNWTLRGIFFKHPDGKSQRSGSHLTVGAK